MKWRIALVSTRDNAAYGAGKMSFLMTADSNTTDMYPVEYDTKEAAEFALRSWMSPYVNWMGYVIPHEGDPTDEGVSSTQKET